MSRANKQIGTTGGRCADVKNALALLQFLTNRRWVTPADVAEALGWHRKTALRWLHSLEETGYPIMRVGTGLQGFRFRLLKPTDNK